MNSEIKTLDDLPLNKKGYIDNILCERKYKKKVTRFRFY